MPSDTLDNSENNDPVLAVIALLASGDFIISGPDDNGAFHISKEKTSKQLSKDGSNLQNTINILNKLGYEMSENKKAEKRIYRKAEDRPRPDLGPNAEENRLQKQFKLRVSPDIPELADEAAKKAGMSRSKWVEMLIRNQIDIK